MKLLGYLFVVVLALAAVGYLRGWFTVAAEARSGHTDVRVTLDDDKVTRDARAVTSAAAAATKRADTARADDIEGRIAELDAAARTLTLQTGLSTTVHRLTADVAITRDGGRLTFADLRTDMRARLSFDDSATPRLVGVMVLP